MTRADDDDDRGRDAPGRRHKPAELNYAPPGVPSSLPEEGESWSDFWRALGAVLVWIFGLIAMIVLIFYGCGRIFGA